MKKVFLYILAAFMFSSCDNLKKKSSTDNDNEASAKKKKALEDDEATDDASKKKKATPNNEEETPLVKRNSNSDENSNDNTDKEKADYSEGWSKANREGFMTVCVSKAKDGMGSESKAENYCACMLDKIQKIYPNANDAGKLTAQRTTQLAQDCIQ
jgi:hydroxymethylpyrimidine/phosphomethylpyrimidine kinase